MIPLLAVRRIERFYTSYTVIAITRHAGCYQVLTAGRNNLHTNDELCALVEIEGGVEEQERQQNDAEHGIHHILAACMLTVVCTFTANSQRNNGAGAQQ